MKIKKMKKRKRALTSTEPKQKPVTSTEAKSRAAARARLTQPASQVPVVDPVFISKGSVLSGAGLENLRRAKASNGQEFIRQPDESLEQFQVRVRNNLPLGVAAGSIAWFEK